MMGSIPSGVVSESISSGRSAKHAGQMSVWLLTRVLQLRHNHASFGVFLLIVFTYLVASEWSISQPAQLPEQSLSVSQSVSPISSRVSCTAHLIPIFCILGFVEISDSIWCPLKRYVSDIDSAKKATTTMAAIMVIKIGDILNR